MTPNFKVIELTGNGQVLSELFVSTSKRESQVEYKQANGTIVLVMIRGNAQKTLDSKGYEFAIKKWRLTDTPKSAS